MPARRAVRSAVRRETRPEEGRECGSAAVRQCGSVQGAVWELFEQPDCGSCEKAGVGCTVKGWRVGCDSEEGCDSGGGECTRHGTGRPELPASGEQAGLQHKYTGYSLANTQVTPSQIYRLEKHKYTGDSSTIRPGK